MPAAVRAVIFLVPPACSTRPVVFWSFWVPLLTRWVPPRGASAAGGGAAIRPVFPRAGAAAGGAAATRRLVLPVVARAVGGLAAGGGATLTATRAVFSPSETEKVNRSLPTWMRSRSERRCSLTFLPLT